MSAGKVTEPTCALIASVSLYRLFATTLLVNTVYASSEMAAPSEPLRKVPLLPVIVLSSTIVYCGKKAFKPMALNTPLLLVLLRRMLGGSSRSR